MTKEQAIALYAFTERFKIEKPLYKLNFEHLMMPYEYGDAINDFVKYWFSCTEPSLPYDDIITPLRENYKNHQWLTSLSENETIAAIQCIIRTDRFVDGFLNSMIENETLPLLLTRLKQIYQ